jgi:repressor LexA
MGRPNNDLDHLGRLRDYYAQNRVLPSYAGLSETLGFRTKNAAVKLAGRLMASGHLEAGPGGRLVPGERFFERSQVDDKLYAGLGNAASPSSGIEHHEIDRLLVDEPSQTILVPIRGDSMSAAGVLDGDIAVVRRTASASTGDFVAALVDGELLVKELRFERSQPVLIPHNKRYRPIRPRSDFSILGVVTGIVRRYGRGAAGARGETR